MQVLGYKYSEESTSSCSGTFGSLSFAGGPDRQEPLRINKKITASPASKC